MAYLETLEHLAILSRKDPAVVENDPFAQLIMQQATELCISTAGIPDPEWETDPTLVPARVRTICLYVAFRTYNNPRSVINSGVGPISESILAQAAAAMQLTEAERDELVTLGEANGVGGLWVLQTTGGPETVMDTQFLPDSSPTDWWIPYFANGDVGTEWDETTPPPPVPGDGGGGSYDGPTMTQFNTLLAQVNALSTTTSSTDAALDSRLDTVEANDVSLDTRLDAAEADLATKAETADMTAALAGKADVSTTNALDTRLDAAEADLATKAETADVDAALALKADSADLGPQIHLGATPPASGSGEVWADTSGT